MSGIFSSLPLSKKSIKIEIIVIKSVKALKSKKSS